VTFLNFYILGQKWTLFSSQTFDFLITFISFECNLQEACEIWYKRIFLNMYNSWKLHMSILLHVWSFCGNPMQSLFWVRENLCNNCCSLQVVITPLVLVASNSSMVMCLNYHVLDKKLNTSCVPLNIHKTKVQVVNKHVNASCAWFVKFF